MSNQNPSFDDADSFGWEISRIDDVAPASEPETLPTWEPVQPEPVQLEPVQPVGVAAEKDSRSAIAPALFIGGMAIAFGASYLISNAALSSTSTTQAVIQPEGPSGGIASSSDSDSDVGSGSGLNSNAVGGSDSEASSDDDQDALVTTSDSLQATLLESVEPTAENPTGAVRYAIYRSGQIFLRGFARDDEAVDRLINSFGSVFGAENVISEYELNPGAPRWTEAPIYFADAVLFDIDSADISPDFIRLLEQTSELLGLGPFVTIRVVAMTDASGSADYNRDLAQRRANAVVDFYVEELGVDEIRIEADILGEERATQSTDSQTAASERRVEFVVSGIRG